MHTDKQQMTHMYIDLKTCYITVQVNHFGCDFFKVSNILFAFFNINCMPKPYNPINQLPSCLWLYFSSQVLLHATHINNASMH